jgi:succinate-semialdehyde dehydrogenase/glutarate-semialdehyde dehydrogenase
MKSINPATNEVLCEYREHTRGEAAAITDQTHRAWLEWKETDFRHRAAAMEKSALLLRGHKEELARLMTLEMGKIFRESLSEVEKCAWVCEFYARNAEQFLAEEIIDTDASISYVVFQPLGVILAVMPWNFPFWQVFRFAAPALMAGNAAVLKHASNVPGCALAIEDLFRTAGFPESLFRTLLVTSGEVKSLIRHPAVRAVTLTGSEPAGKEVAAEAGKQIKKTVLELGGSDPFIILDDCDLELTVKNAVSSRLVNQGQSCIAAKRFLVMQPVLDEFIRRLKGAFHDLKMGDPLDQSTDIGPLARADLVDDLDRQVSASVSAGARLIAGGKRLAEKGNYYHPTILSEVRKGMPAFDEETFGPLLAIIPVQSEEEAIALANDSPFGLGGSIWTADTIRGERIARRIESGSVFVNGMMKSDPRLPFGGIKRSGYGRELGSYGIREFVNIKTIWVK